MRKGSTLLQSAACRTWLTVYLLAAAADSAVVILEVAAAV
jgi:hypothetical protein